MRNKFPCHCSQEVIIQHNNASPQSFADDDEILAACNETLTVKSAFQPANSSDSNVLDLGCFLAFSPFRMKELLLVFKT